MSPQGSYGITIRKARPEDAAVCGPICYRAFSAINAAHNFPCDFPNVEAATGVLSAMFSSPGCYGVVVELDGRIIGSNCLDERSAIHGVGPITVDPDVQNKGLGRALMEAVMARSAESGAPGIRLVQAAFHNRSMSLYAGLGFDVREPLACMQGRTFERAIAGCSVRPARQEDVADCNALSHRVHGFERGQELSNSIALGGATVVERSGRVTGYSSGLAFYGHATAESNPDLEALLTSAESFGGPGILVPTRNHALFRWCLSNGLRVVQPMTLMTMGLYNEPQGAWLPSILF